MHSSCPIVYLDQNQWINLARAKKYPAKYTELSSLLNKIEIAVSKKRLLLPLTSSNIYETSKINRIDKRKDIATIQCHLSQGIVFRGRHACLKQEISNFISKVLDRLEPLNEANWFLSKIFTEAFADIDDPRAPLPMTKHLIDHIKYNPSSFLYDFLVNQPDEDRRKSVKVWSEGSAKLQKRVERRRFQTQHESLALRKRIYKAELMLDEIQNILQFSLEAGANWKTVNDMGDKNARKLMQDVPSLYIETELAVKTETLDREIEENDFRDMASFCTAIPYADCVISENLFVNMARQANLDKKFNTTLTTDIMALHEYVRFKAVY